MKDTEKFVYRYLLKLAAPMKVSKYDTNCMALAAQFVAAFPGYAPDFADLLNTRTRLRIVLVKLAERGIIRSHWTRGYGAVEFWVE
ncbi:helix-turn-helix DNA binding domain protein [Rhodobacter phage RcDurkin]|nr:helix-turn-helix DNA binding domain protein [Rhodobacter phage RcDurkin]QXN72579.1 helix-turn-helix DNA binding domain protein [Rhodobacter phage RcTiptonus]UUV43854.1 helix-turn-helix DNA binding domain protein [Rhodobacter phage RcKickapoo]UUV44480.1 helix-turn-helix DNA binding domain protein [Rhodobacter phage RcMenchie]